MADANRAIYLPHLSPEVRRRMELALRELNKRGPQTGALDDVARYVSIDMGHRETVLSRFMADVLNNPSPRFDEGFEQSTDFVVLIGPVTES